MPDDPLETNPPPAGVAVVTPVGKRFTCVGCGCTMTANGQDIWSLGEGYKEWKEQSAKHAKAIEKLNEEISALRAELTAVKTERDALKGSGVPATSGHRPGRRIQ
jgi:hypothetical protein